MSDLVKRLRRFTSESDDPDIRDLVDSMTEGADRIEELEGALKQIISNENDMTMPRSSAIARAALKVIDDG